LCSQQPINSNTLGRQPKENVEEAWRQLSQELECCASFIELKRGAKKIPSWWRVLICGSCGWAFEVSSTIIMSFVFLFF